jgi:hypothetical protein
MIGILPPSGGISELLRRLEQEVGFTVMSRERATQLARDQVEAYASGGRLRNVISGAC